MDDNKDTKILFSLPLEQQEDLANILNDFFQFRNSNYTNSFYNMLKILSYLTYDKYKTFLKIQVGRYIVGIWNDYKEEKIFRYFEEILNGSHICKYHYTALLLLFTHPDAIQRFLYKFNKYILGESSILSLFVKSIVEMLDKYQFDLEKSGYQGNPAESLYLHHIIEILTYIFVNPWKQPNKFLHNIFFREVTREIVGLLLKFDCNPKMRAIISTIFQENYLPYTDDRLSDQQLNYKLYMDYLIHYSIINYHSCIDLLIERLKEYNTCSYNDGIYEIVDSYSNELNQEQIKEFCQIIKISRYYNRIDYKAIDLKISIFNFFKQYNYLDFCHDFEDLYFNEIIYFMGRKEFRNQYYDLYNKFISKNLTYYLKVEDYDKFEILRRIKNENGMFQYPVASTEVSHLIITEIESVTKKNIKLFNELKNHYEQLKSEIKKRDDQNDPFIEQQSSLFF